MESLQWPAYLESMQIQGLDARSLYFNILFFFPHANAIIWVLSCISNKKSSVALATFVSSYIAFYTHDLESCSPATAHVWSPYSLFLLLSRLHVANGISQPQILHIHPFITTYNILWKIITFFPQVTYHFLDTIEY